MSELVYEASVYKQTVKYTNFKGETQEKELFFALDPIQLMQVIAGFTPKQNKRSGDPRKQNQEQSWTEEEQIKFVRDLASKSAGTPSDDGETWYPYEDFDKDLAGKAFLTKLVSSDADRKAFAEKVILDPFRAFVGYATADPSNAPKEIQQFKVMAEQLENVFTERSTESLEERRARLQAELEAMNGPSVEG